MVTISCKIDFTRVVYRGGTGSFFGIGILPVSDLLDFRYFGRYRSPPFLYTSPLSSPLFSKRGSSFSKRGPLPPFWGKRGALPPFLYRNVPTEFSFGIGMVNTEKYRPNTDRKYRIGIQLYKIRTPIILSYLRIYTLEYCMLFLKGCAWVEVSLRRPRSQQKTTPWEIHPPP